MTGCSATDWPVGSNWVLGLLHQTQITTFVHSIRYDLATCLHLCDPVNHNTHRMSMVQPRTARTYQGHRRYLYWTIKKYSKDTQNIPETIRIILWISMVIWGGPNELYMFILSVGLTNQDTCTGPLPNILGTARTYQGHSGTSYRYLGIRTKRIKHTLGKWVSKRCVQGIQKWAHLPNVGKRPWRRLTPRWFYPERWWGSNCDTLR